MSSKKLFSIIIANYNKAANIRPLLESVYDHHSHDDMEVFFMDDASTDQSVAIAEQFPVKIYRGIERVGPATLRNRAALEARGDYLLFVDSDVILPAGTIPRFRELCLAGEFGAVSGLEVLPPVIDNWIGWFRTLYVQDNFGEYRQKEDDIEAWGSTLGGVRRQLFLDCGGFNQAFRGADVEDHELAIRMVGRERMLFSPNMTYRHSYPGTVDLIRKQFKRSFQMVQLEVGTLLKSSLFFHWRYKGGHILSAAIVATALAWLRYGALGYLLLVLIVFKVWLNWYLFSQALRVKGFRFMLYSFLMSLVMGVSIVFGAMCGKVRQVFR